MFGYIDLYAKALEEERVARYKAYYCGLCREIRSSYGQLGRLSLSNDMTFLCVLLSSLYEPTETDGSAKCPVHPIKERAYIESPATSYAADMNMVLAYWKYRDGEKDDGSRLQSRMARNLKKAYDDLCQRYPRQCQNVEENLKAIWDLEDAGTDDIDALCRISGQMFGAVFVWKEDAFAPVLYHIGEGLGRFVYLMDAYEDKKQDEKKHRYNPLLHNPDTDEETIRDSLTSMVAMAGDALELLPLEKDVDLIRNVVYQGVWNRYTLLNSDDKKEKGEEAET